MLTLSPFECAHIQLHDPLRMCLSVTEGSWVNVGAENVSFADAGETIVYQYTVSPA